MFVPPQLSNMVLQPRNGRVANTIRSADIGQRLTGLAAPNGLHAISPAASLAMCPSIGIELSFSLAENSRKLRCRPSAPAAGRNLVPNERRKAMSRNLPWRPEGYHYDGLPNSLLHCGISEASDVGFTSAVGLGRVETPRLGPQEKAPPQSEPRVSTLLAAAL
jgi:hypothetical protein